MAKLYKKVREKVVKGSMNIVNRTNEALNNERGAFWMEYILLAMILILAVVAIKGNIVDGFGSVAAWFETTILTEVQKIL